MNAPGKVLERHRWTVTEYRRTGETGTLAPDARAVPVTLIDGVTVDLSTLFE